MKSTGLVREDAAIGLVFPPLFSLGVILASRYADDVHLDIDAVLLGELAFALRPLVVAGWDWGRAGLWVMAAILVVNLLRSSLFWKELKLATFDAASPRALGPRPSVDPLRPDDDPCPSPPSARSTRSARSSSSP